MVLVTNGAYFDCGVLEHSSKTSEVFLVSVLGGGRIWILLNTHLILISKYPVRGTESSSKLQEWRSQHWRAQQAYFDGAGKKWKSQENVYPEDNFQLNVGSNCAHQGVLGEFYTE